MANRKKASLPSTFLPAALFFCLSCVTALCGQSPPATPQAGVKLEQPATPVSSGDPTADFASARHLMQLGKFDEAIALLLDLQARQPAAPGLARELGIAYYKKGDYQSAGSNLARAQTENPADQEATQLLGLSDYLSGRPAQAIPQLEKVQTWYASANVDASYILGICYIQTKDYPHARAAFAKMFAVPPDSAASYLLDRAYAAYVKTLARSPKSMRKKPPASIPNFPWCTNSSASCTFTNRKSPKPSPSCKPS